MRRVWHGWEQQFARLGRRYLKGKQYRRNRQHCDAHSCYEHGFYGNGCCENGCCGNGCYGYGYYGYGSYR